MHGGLANFLTWFFVLRGGLALQLTAVNARVFYSTEVFVELHTFFYKTMYIPRFLLHLSLFIINYFQLILMRKTLVYPCIIPYFSTFAAMEFLNPTTWKDYELIDCGDFEKLERFGEYITIRPEPQAIWDKKLSEREWEKMAHVRFMPKSSSAGEWKKLKQMPDQWKIKYDIGGQQKSQICFRLGLTSFKHVGVFPEQAVNWDYIYNSVHEMKSDSPPLRGGAGGGVPKVLNLFAYTGGASLAAKAAGADITHLDSIKQVVSWARENMELSGLDNIRWLVEDALTFVRREIKRGNKYHGIILDPPAFGHGPTGEKWKLEENINEMMKNVLSLLDDKKHFLILNGYSLGFSSIIMENLLREKAGKNLKTGELFIQSSNVNKLPLGVFGRFRNF